jgi:hypothetical protein
MEAYLLKSDVDHYKAFQMCRSADLDVAFRFDGRSLKEEWVSLSVRPIDDEENERLPHGDFPYLTTFPVVSVRGFECLGNILSTGAEFLPLKWGNQLLYAINVTTIVDGIDEARSRLEYLPSGPLFRITKHEFIPDLVRGHPVFKIKQDPLVNVYVNQDVATLIRSCGLVGAQLRRVWEAPDG